LFRICGSLDVSEPCGFPLPVMWMGEEYLEEWSVEENFVAIEKFL
jgi:hypothetical protein